MQFSTLFPATPAVIACIHLQSLPGSPRYAGSMRAVCDTALQELEIYERAGVHGVIVENFRDQPFYPGIVPPETIASMSVVLSEIMRSTRLPVGVNVLRNDAAAALAIATATGAAFIRINVHLGAVVGDQGIIEGKAYETLRMRARLESDVLIFADAAVKHAAPLAPRGLEAEVRDLEGRGLADAIIISGTATGAETDMADLTKAKGATRLPVLIGSGCTPQNIAKMAGIADGFIVGSAFKHGGVADGSVDRARVEEMIAVMRGVG